MNIPSASDYLPYMPHGHGEIPSVLMLIILSLLFALVVILIVALFRHNRKKLKKK